MASSAAFRRFTDRVLAKSFVYSRALRPSAARVDAALKLAVADARYHEPAASGRAVAERIMSGDHHLPVFLYRLGRGIFTEDPAHPLLKVIHGVMREACACEIYFSNEIGAGLRLVHGLGTVIGSRNRIGKGFTIYQGSTIGHREVGEPGAMIGSDVTVYAHALVLGAVRVGDRAVIAAQAVVLKNVPAGATMLGSPAKARIGR